MGGQNHRKRGEMCTRSSQRRLDSAIETRSGLGWQPEYSEVLALTLKETRKSQKYEGWIKCGGGAKTREGREGVRQGGLGTGVQTLPW